MTSSAQLEQPAEEFRTIDHEYRDMAKAYPGFGGLFHDEEGVVNVYVTGDANRAEIGRLADGEVNFLPAEFAWDELFEVRERISDIMAEPGTVYLDIDEKRNRVVVGISGIGKQAVARKASIAARYGVSEKALELREIEPIQMHVSLRDSRRPVPGGMQITYGNFLCTLGFSVVRNGVNGFITNSHCSTAQGGNQNTSYGQGSNQTIAQEQVDPTYRSNLANCPAGRRCRLSDSLFASYNGNANGQKGRIARPTCRNCNNLTIGNNGRKRFNITSEGSVGVGTTVHKVGRTTGWTSGTKTDSCVTINALSGNVDTGLTLICQDLANYNSNGGDSGSPVFRRRGGAKVQLVGINWGGNAQTAVYSPISQVKQELGNFDALR
ncbi:MAG: hypothetical protein AAGM22_19310 [Acidobacteriota bacterium]